jgi:AcrR family transcriptional regulator
MVVERPKRKRRRVHPKRAAKVAAVELAIERRRADVTRLRLSGWSMRDIAAHLGVSLGTIHGDLTAVFERTADRADDHVRRERETSLARIDAMTKGLWPKASTGDHEAVNSVRKLEERRAKLEGLDAASRHEVSGPDGAPVELVAPKSNLAEKLVDLAARLAGREPQPGGEAGSQSGSPG